MTPSAAIILGLVLIALGIPMIRKWIPRIGFDALLMPGITMTDDVWYESHRRSGWDLVMVGAGLIVLAVWMGRMADPSAGVRDFLGVCMIVGLLVAAVRSVVVTIHLARHRDFSR